MSTDNQAVTAVFIVMQGENHEGGSVVAVTSSLESARLAALEAMDGHWAPGVWGFAQLVADELDSWQRGCDWMNIRKHTVGGAA
jgi:hypothetical protein|tara:strand:- start:1308 stop:1559 length:252 start_codon:yes stop_codon:yes gene_type:complete